MSKVEELSLRVELLLQRHADVRATCAALIKERDSLRSRLNAARQRIDALLDRLPDEPIAGSADWPAPNAAADPGA